MTIRIDKIDFVSNLSHEMAIHSVKGNIVDIINKRTYKGELIINNGLIEDIKEYDVETNLYIIPPFIDSHVHIESSMLVPSEFARASIKHGVIACVSDPHEIANVLGVEGVVYMINQGSGLPFRFFFGAPSCVPATPFETSGAVIDDKEIEQLLGNKDIHYLSEVMNFPGVINGEKTIISKINIAKRHNKKIDGHAPLLSRADLDKYLSYGIDTDHETTSYQEGREKLQKGMKLLIREGSAAKNLDELAPLINEFPDKCMFCSDDIHPDYLINGHINIILKRLINAGYDLYKILRCACLNPSKHYGIDIGLLQKGQRADLLIVDNLNDLNIISTIVKGSVVATSKDCFIEQKGVSIINKFNTGEKVVSDFSVKYQGGKIRVIEAIDGQILTNELILEPKVENNLVVQDISRDILKIAVINRYQDCKPAIGFIRGFSLQSGAIVSSIAHDSHNIVVVGTNDKDMTKAVNSIIKHKGGICICQDGDLDILPLPVAGIMSDKDAWYVAKCYDRLDKKAKKLGCSLSAPFMTLSFMALLVIPTIKIGDKGLFDVRRFEVIPLFVT
ncbi:MAG: adenine deaminase [Thermodesulfovibrionales bacterium]|nr:adenine deaminase [Thermodesulfovibrionales bacterium]